jgi:hypothetical protein
MTLRQALGGPWAAHWLFLVGLLPPTTLLVLVRETATPFPDWWWPLLSALAQHLVAGAVIVMGGAIGRRFHEYIPLPTVFSIWALAAILRGVVAGVVAQSVAGDDPEFGSRIATWLLVSIVWLPAMVYAIAQFERRRAVLGAIDVTEFELSRERPLTDASTAEVQHQLRQTIAETITPALSDLQASLEANRGALDRTSVAELSLRLSQLHDDTADVLESELPVAPPAPAPLVGLRRALDVPPRLPWISAALVVGATVVLIVFDAWRIFGPLAALEVIVAAVGGGAVLGVVPALAGALRPSLLDAHGQRITIVALILGIITGCSLMLTSGIDPITWHGLLIVPLLAMGLTIASAMYYSAIVLADANAEADARLATLRSALATLTAHNERVLDVERQRLSELVHGPVQGRIAACIMALNFHANSESTAEQARTLSDSVLEHLRSVSRDLEQIAAGAGGPPTTT